MGKLEVFQRDSRWGVYPGSDFLGLSKKFEDTCARYCVLYWEVVRSKLLASGLLEVVCRSERRRSQLGNLSLLILHASESCRGSID